MSKHAQASNAGRLAVGDCIAVAAASLPIAVGVAKAASLAPAQRTETTGALEASGYGLTQHSFGRSIPDAKSRVSRNLVTDR